MTQQQQKRKNERNNRRMMESYFKSVELKSLQSVWCTIVFTLIQLACIYRAYVNINKFNTQTWQPYEKPVFEIYCYVFALLVSVFLLPIYIWTSMFKIGSYSNDQFKFGLDLDTSQIYKKELKRQHTISRVRSRTLSTTSRPKTTTTTTTGSSSSDLMPPHAHTIKTRSQSNFSINEKRPHTINQAQLKRYNSNLETESFVSSSASPVSFKSNNNNDPNVNLNPAAPATYTSHLAAVFRHLNAFVSVKNKWKHFVPVSSFVHLLMSFALLLPNVLLVSKEIQYGLRPKGNIHHTELDFLFSRPLQRFSETTDDDKSSLKLVDSFETNKMTSLKYKLISALLEDNDEINYQPQISLELFNYILACISFAISYASTIWHVNKCLSLLFSFHIVAYSALSLLSFSAFEILYKFQTTFSHGIKFTSVNHVDEANVNQTVSTSTEPTAYQLLADESAKQVEHLPFLTDPTRLTFVFLSSMLLYMFSSIPVYWFVLNRYKSKFNKLRNYFLIFIDANRLNATTSSNELKKIPESMSGNDIHHLNRNENETKKGSIEDDKFEFLTASVNKNVGNAHIIPLILPPMISLNKSNHTTALPTRSFSVMNSSLTRITSSNINNNNNNNPASNVGYKKANAGAGRFVLRNSFMTASSSDSNLSRKTSLNSLHLLNDDCKHATNASVYKPYKSHIYALLILVLISVNSVFFFYDCVCLHRLTSDYILLWAAVCHALFILWYIILWSGFTIKSDVSIQFSQLFKLNYWYFLNKLISVGVNFSNNNNNSNTNQSRGVQAPVVSTTNESILYSRVERNKLLMAAKKEKEPLISSSYTTNTSLVHMTDPTHVKNSSEVDSSPIYDTGLATSSLSDDCKLMSRSGGTGSGGDTGNYDNSSNLNLNSLTSNYSSSGSGSGSGPSSSSSSSSSSPPSVNNLLMSGNKIGYFSLKNDKDCAQFCDEDYDESKNLFDKIDSLLEKTSSSSSSHHNNSNLNDNAGIYENFKSDTNSSKVTKLNSFTAKLMSANANFNNNNNNNNTNNNINNYYHHNQLPNHYSHASNNLKRINQIMTSDQQRLEPLLENGSILSTASTASAKPEHKFPPNTTKSTNEQTENNNNNNSNKIYEYDSLNDSSDSPSTRFDSKLWKNKSNENILINSRELLSAKKAHAEPAAPLLNDLKTGKLNDVKKPQQLANIITLNELEKIKSNSTLLINNNNNKLKYSSNISIKTKPTNDLYSSASQINKNCSNVSLNNLRAQLELNKRPVGGQKNPLSDTNARLLLKDYLAKNRDKAIQMQFLKEKEQIHQLINGGNETDSGRHSMSDSPCSINPANNNNNNNNGGNNSSSDQTSDVSLNSNSTSSPNNSVSQSTHNTAGSIYAVKLMKACKNSNEKLNAAGTFTSKCTLSTGNSVTLSQTVQNLQPKHQTSGALQQPPPLPPPKRTMSRSSSKDSGILNLTSLPKTNLNNQNNNNNNNNGFKTSNTSVNLNKF